MGTDIRLCVEVKGSDHVWRYVKNLPARRCPKHYPDDCPWCDGDGVTTEAYNVRDYLLFAILAAVRDYYWVGIKPISAPKGLPLDVSAEAVEEVGDDYSQSYFTISELDQYDWDQQYPSLDEEYTRGTGIPRVNCRSFFEFIDSIRPLGAPDDVRIVFGFN